MRLDLGEKVDLEGSGAALGARLKTIRDDNFGGRLRFTFRFGLQDSYRDNLRFSLGASLGSTE